MYQIMPNAYSYLVNCIRKNPITCVLIASLVGTLLTGTTTAITEKSAASNLGKTATDTGETIKKTIKAARSQAENAYETLAEPVKKNPLTSTVIASLVGSLVTWFFQRRG